MSEREISLEEARRALGVCVDTRRRVQALVAMSEEEQKRCDQKEVFKDFYHLWMCLNGVYFKTLTGSSSGSGKCNALWKELWSRSAQSSDLVWDYMYQIEHPDVWPEVLDARRREARGEKMSLFDRVMGGITRWIFTEYEKNETKLKEKQGRVEKKHGE